VTILVQPGTYFECVSIVNRAGTIQCADPTQRFEIESMDWSGCLGGTAMVTIQNSDIDMKWFNLVGDDTYTRTGILSIDSTVDVEQASIYNGAPYGIDIEGDSHLSINMITIQNAENQTGINIDSGMTGSLTMDNSQLYGHAGIGGRGLSSMSAVATIAISNSMFQNHQPMSGSGGAVKVAGGNLSIIQSSIANAFAPHPGHGAGLLFSATGASSLALIDCSFIDCQVGGVGGGAYVNAHADDSITIESCVFSGNDSGIGASSTGGSGINVSTTGGVQVVLQDCDFFDNTSAGLSDSSAVRQSGSGSVQLIDCLVCGNEEPPFAGALTMTGDSMVVNSCSEGACCVGTTCGQMTQAGCLSLDGTWSGSGSDCANVVCAAGADGACCLGGYCMVTSEMDCLYNEGVFLGASTQCATANCAGLGVPPSGACCNSGLCVETTEVLCNASGGSWAGIGSECGSASCPVACQSDVVRDQVVDVYDLIQVLADWGMCP
jgi:hypothetical protein